MTRGPTKPTVRNYEKHLVMIFKESVFRIRNLTGAELSACPHGQGGKTYEFTNNSFSSKTRILLFIYIFYIYVFRRFVAQEGLSASPPSRPGYEYETLCGDFLYSYDTFHKLALRQWFLCGFGRCKELLRSYEIRKRFFDEPGGSAKNGISTTGIRGDTRMSDEKNGRQTPFYKASPPHRWAFYGEPGAYAKSIAAHTESDPVGILTVALIVIGNINGYEPRPYFMVEETPHHTNDYLVLVGESGESRKGTAFDHAQAPLRWMRGDEFFDDWFSRHILGGTGSGEGVISRIHDDVMEDVPILGDDKQVIGWERKVKTKGIDDKRLLIDERELATMLRVMERSGSTVSPILRKGWDGNGILELGTKLNAMRATDAHISIVASITPTELRRLLNATDIANGFANRFLMLLVSRDKFLPRSNDESRRAKRAAAQHEFAAAYQASRVFQVSQSKSEMHFSKDAEDAWVEAYGEKKRRGPLNYKFSGLVYEMPQRGPQQVLRLAMIYALLDCSSVIELPHLLAALSLWDYNVRCIQLLFGNRLGDAEADVILDALRAAKGQTLRQSDVFRVFDNNKKKREIESTIQRLINEGFAQYDPDSKMYRLSQEQQPKIEFLQPFETPQWAARYKSAEARMRELRKKYRAEIKKTPKGKVVAVKPTVEAGKLNGAGELKLVPEDAPHEGR